MCQAKVMSLGRIVNDDGVTLFSAINLSNALMKMETSKARASIVLHSELALP